jgi:hypothetical protein
MGQGEDPFVCVRFAGDDRHNYLLSQVRKVSATPDQQPHRKDHSLFFSLSLVRTITMKLFASRSLFWFTGASSLLLHFHLPTAVATVTSRTNDNDDEELSIGLVTSNWAIETTCSAALDTLEAKLLSHVDAEMIGAPSFANTNNNIILRHALTDYDCSQVCHNVEGRTKYDPLLCHRVTRGYCGSSSSGHRQYPPLAAVAGATVPDDDRPAHFDNNDGETNNTVTAGHHHDHQDDPDDNGHGHRQLLGVGYYNSCEYLCRCYDPASCRLLTRNECKGTEPDNKTCRELARLRPAPPSAGVRFIAYYPSNHPPTQPPGYKPPVSKPTTKKINKKKPKRHLQQIMMNDGPAPPAPMIPVVIAAKTVDAPVVPVPAIVAAPPSLEPPPLLRTVDDVLPHLPYYHCPTYCRRVPSGLCVHLTHGFCDGNDNHNNKYQYLVPRKGATLASAQQEGAGQALRGGVGSGAAVAAVAGTSRKNKNNDILLVDNNDDDNCATALAVMEAKFDTLVGDLNDPYCARAIAQANVHFQCSSSSSSSFPAHYQKKETALE